MHSQIFLNQFSIGLNYHVGSDFYRAFLSVKVKTMMQI